MMRLRLLRNIVNVRSKPKPAPLSFYKDYERLDQEIKDYLEQNDRIISIKRVEFRQFYDSTWMIRMLLDGQVVEKRIVRRDIESHMNLARLLQKVDSVETLAALDQRARIYYD